MGEPVIELYSPEYLAGLRNGNRIRKIILWVLILGGLSACILLCLNVTTRNSTSRMLWTMGVSTLTGWIAIYLYVFGYRAAKREIAHGEHLQDGPREAVTGRVEFSPKAIRIRNSISCRKLVIHTENGEVKANINASRSRELQKAGQELTVYLRHGYVTAYEVHHEIY